MQIQTIRLDKITLPSFLHRVSLDADALAALAQSLRDHGLINPITVEQQGESYILRAGHRRLEAARLCGWTTITANVRAPDELLNGEALTWVENLDREALSPMEEARALNRAHHDHGIPVETLAQRLHRSTGWVEQRIALYALPDALAAHVHTRALPMAHALALMEVEDLAHRDYLSRYAINGGASIATLRDWIRQWQLYHARGDGATAPRPDMPVEGAEHVLRLPCYICGAVQRHDHLRVIRTCPACAHALANAGEPASPDAGTTTAPH